jgi:hypothetical protein
LLSFARRSGESATLDDSEKEMAKSIRENMIAHYIVYTE